MKLTKTVGMEGLSLDLHMTNFDHTIDDGLDEALRARPSEVYAFHTAWNFCGRVWFDGEGFIEEVWRYGTPVGCIAAPTLEQLMQDVNNECGDD